MLMMASRLPSVLDPAIAMRSDPGAVSRKMGPWPVDEEPAYVA
jgi:hypothetical protein